jgi:hypothetical protein
MNIIEQQIDKIKSAVLHDVEVLVWRMTATNALRVLNDLDPENAAKYNAALEALK